MTNKIKLLLWSFLIIIFVWLSTTSALELKYLRSYDKTCLANKNGKNLLDLFSNYGAKYYFSCIQEGLSQSSLDLYWRNIQVEQFESKTYKILYSEASNGLPFSYSNVIYWGAYSDYFNLWKDEKWLYVFSKFKKGENTIYRRNMLRITEDTPVKVKSNRGSAVYKQWYVLNGLQLYTKQGNQGRLASVIDNTYILDWYGFVVDNRTLRVMDTYSNKLYKYKTLTDNDLAYLPRVLFYNLYNQVPDDIYDVEWNKGSNWYFYWKDSEYINYEIENSKKWTEEDLKKIQQDLKNSIQILNREDIDFYLGMQPEELGISSNPDLPKNNNENTGNTVPKNTTREEKKSCVEYYTYMRSMSSHSDGCLGEVNKDMSDTRLDYWWAISTDWDLSKFWVRDKTKYRRCWHWNNYKEGVKKTLWDKWPAFWKDRQTNYIATEAKDIDVNALCSHIVVEKSFEKTDPFSFSWMVALWWALRGILDNVWQKVKVWDSEIAVNTLSWDIGRYYTYAQACRDKRYMQTPIDSKLSYIIGYDFFFNSSNNEKVCEYAEILKKNIEKKYWGKEIDKKYRDARANELEEKWTTWDFKNVFNDKWEIDILKLENSANKTHSNPFKDPEDVLGLRKILWFFQKDFDAWVNLVYNSLSGQRCWEWIWIKEWDYIMRLFVFIIWFVLFKWRN